MPVGPAILKCMSFSAIPALGGETFTGTATDWVVRRVVFTDGAGEFVGPMLVAPWCRSAFVRPEGQAEGSEGGDIERSLLPLTEAALLNTVCIAPVNVGVFCWSGLWMAFVMSSVNGRSREKL